MMNPKIASFGGLEVFLLTAISNLGHWAISNLPTLTQAILLASTSVPRSDLLFPRKAWFATTTWGRIEVELTVHTATVTTTFNPQEFRLWSKVKCIAQRLANDWRTIVELASYILPSVSDEYFQATLLGHRHSLMMVSW